MNLEDFATNLSNEPAAQLLSKSNFILLGYDEKGKNNFLNFFIEQVLKEDQNSVVFYINNPDSECSHKRIALMGQNYTSTIDYLYSVFLSRKKKAKTMEQIYVIIRDLNDLIKDPLIRYHKDSEQDESFAIKIHKLINEGSEKNINFILNVESEQIPEQIKSGFVDYIFFKMYRKVKTDHTQLDLNTIKKENQFIYNNNLFVINDEEYSFKLKEEDGEESELQKNIKKFTSKVLETDINNLTNLDLTKNILIKLFCNYGATAVEEPKYKMSEVNFNFSYHGKIYSVFIYKKGSKKELDSALELASKLEKSHAVIIANVSDSELSGDSYKNQIILNKKDLIDLIKYKIDEDKITDQEIKNTISSRLKFFNQV